MDDVTVAEADARAEAMRCVLTVVLESIRPGGLNRTKFRKLMAQASQSVPSKGPAAVQHHVFLAEARRVLGEEDAAA